MRKINIVYKKKRNKIGKLIRNKKIIVFFCLITIILTSLINTNTINVKSADIDENYSQYLSNNAITIKDDKAMLLKSVASSGTNYRTIFENNFLFPSKLSNQALNLYGNDKSSYSVVQSYMNDLDNDYNYKNNDNSENIQQNINVDNYNILNGTYVYKSRIINNVVVNNDITKQWDSTSATHYTEINDYSSWNTYIYSTGNSKIDCFDIEDIAISNEIQNITLQIGYHRYPQRYSNDIKFALLNVSNVLQEQILNYGADYYDPFFKTFYLYYYNLNLSQNDINNLRLRIKSCSTGVGMGTEYVGGILIHMYEKAKNHIASANYGNSFLDNFDDGIRNSKWLDDANMGVISETGGYIKYSAGTSGANWWTGVYGAPLSSILLVTSLDFVAKIKIINTEATDCHFYGLHLYQNDQNVWQIGHNENSGGGYYDNIKMIKIIGGTGYEVLESTNELAHTNSYLRIRKVSTTYYFDYSTNDISYTNLYSTSSIGITPIRIGVFHGCWVNVNLDVNFDNFNIDYGVYSQLGLTSEKNINYYNYANYKPIYYDLKIQISNNISIQNYNIYVFDYDLNRYNKEITVSSKSNLYSFRFNLSAYYRLNKFKILINMTNTLPFLSYILNSYLQITYVKENDLGYQYQVIKFKEYDNAMSYLGYFQLEVKIYKDYISYRYLEVSSGYDNYDYNWLSYNLSLNNVELDTFEILGSARYGYNTLIQEISNVQFIMYLNNNEKNITLIEQNRKGLFTGKNYNLEFNYTAVNRNYLNITGIIGNYSYCSLSGIRCLKGVQNTIYNRWFSIPFFWEKISVVQFNPTSTTLSNPNEPEAPSGSKYWTYNSFRILADTSFSTDVGNWSIDFTPIKVDSYTAKYYYTEKTIKESSWGSWTFKIGDWKISFDFIRDALVGVINLIILLFQWIFYLLVAALSYLFLFIGCYILWFLVNVVVYYIYIGLCWIVWFLWVLLYWLYTILIWVWQYIIYPVLQWAYYVLLPLVITAIIKIMAFMLTCFIFVLTLGKINFWDTYHMIENILIMIVDLIIRWIIIFVDNIQYLLLFFIWYLICAAFIYFKYLYNKARGNINRAEQLHYTFEIYIAPIKFIWDLLKSLWESAPEI